MLAGRVVFEGPRAHRNQEPGTPPATGRSARGDRRERGTSDQWRSPPHQGGQDRKPYTDHAPSEGVGGAGCFFPGGAGLVACSGDSAPRGKRGPLRQLRSRPAQVPAQELVDHLGAVSAHARGHGLRFVPLRVIDADRAVLRPAGCTYSFQLDSLALYVQL